MAGTLIIADFKNKAHRETPEQLDLCTIHDLAGELSLPSLPDSYRKGKECILMQAGENEDAFSLTILPYRNDDGFFKEAGFRLRVTLENAPGRFTHSEIFFDEVEKGQFRQSGFYRPRDKHGGMIYPKLVNDTIKAFVRRMIEHTQRIPSFALGSPKP